MERNTLLGIIVLVLILGLVGSYALLQPSPVVAPTTTSTNPILPENGYVEHVAYYDITADYATTTPLMGSASDTAVSFMEQFVSDTITQFKTDGNFANLTPEDIKMLGFDQGRKETLNIVYLVATTKQTVSYIFTIYEDTLGAHGNTFFHTFTFDTKTGVLLSLKDLFISGANYLNVLSTMSQAKLPGVIGGAVDVSFIQEGTTPEEKSFEKFFLGDTDFVILFEPYAVAPYSAGPQTLRIPISELSNILKPEYR